MITFHRFFETHQISKWSMSDWGSSKSLKKKGKKITKRLFSCNSFSFLLPLCKCQISLLCLFLDGTTRLFHLVPLVPRCSRSISRRDRRTGLFRKLGIFGFYTINTRAEKQFRVAYYFWDFWGQVSGTPGSCHGLAFACWKEETKWASLRGAIKKPVFFGIVNQRLLMPR